KKATPPAMMNFGERDLLDMAEAAGFGDLYLRLDLSVRRAPELPWDGFFRSSPNPLSPTVEEAVHAALTPDEAERFVAHLRPLVERREGTERLAFAYLSGRK